MTDKDNLLLEQFFKAAAEQQIEDGGFTERVMSSLEVSLSTQDNSRFSFLTAHSSFVIHMWTLFCIAVAALLFFVFGGMDLLNASLSSLLHTAITWFSVFVRVAPTVEIHLNPVVVLLLAGFVLIFLPYQIVRRLYATL